MTIPQISTALTSTLIGPALGAALVILAWLVALLREGVPIRAQLEHARGQLRPVALPALGAVGIALLAGEPWRVAIATGVSAGLVAAGFRAPPAAP